MSQIVKTPQGNVSFPDEMSPEEIKIVLNAQFGKPKVQTKEDSKAMPQNPRQRGSTISNPQSAGQRAMDFLRDNMEIPGGIGGSVSGALVGTAVGGPIGGVAGAIAGGALGSGGGSLASDLLNNRELNLAEATKEAAISAGFDVAFLGLGKVVKPVVAKVIKDANKNGLSPEATLQKIAEVSGEKFPQAGSKESLAASQSILSQSGATLLPTQVGAGTLPDALEKIARVGLLSSSRIEANEQAVNQVVGEQLSGLFNKNFIDVGTDSDSLGQAAFTIISEGKKALSERYGQALEEIATRAGSKQVPIKPVLNALDSFSREYRKEGLGSVMSDEAANVVTDLTTRLSENPTMRIPLSSLIELDKLINKEVSSFSDVRSQKFNSVVSQELTQLSNKIKDSIADVMKTTDAETAKVYKLAKDEYSAGMDGILPKINQNTVSRANAGNYAALGQLLAGTGNISQIKALQKSLKESFARVSKQEQDIPGFISEADADKLMRKAFLENTFPSIPKGEFNVESYARLSSKFAKPNEDKKLRLILGEDYPKVKQLLNLMTEASKKPDSNLGQFVVRSKEYETISKVLQLSAASGAPVYGGPLGFAGSAALLLAPRMMANYVTNPKNINRLIAFENTKFKSEAAKETAFAAILGDIWESLPEDEKQAVIEEVHTLGQQERQ